MLRQTLVADQITALKAGEKTKLDTLRFLISQIKNKEVDLHRELAEDEVISEIRKMVKELDEAAKVFETGGRTDLAEANKTQVQILTAYLPAEISDEELLAKIKSVIENNPSLAGQKSLIGVCVRELKSFADPTRISKVASSLL